MEWKNKKVSIIGLARSGLAAANQLAGRGADVTVMDSKSDTQLKDIVSQLKDGIKTVFGTSKPLPDAELVVISPGVPIDSPDLKEARNAGVEIISELEVAFRLCSTPIIAITGTNGKSTTTALIGEILKNDGKNIAVGGNIGVPAVSLVEPAPRDFLVLEVSSFQLESISTFRPFVSVLLNLTQDHLDRHHSLKEYAAMKERITENQTPDDFLIANWDDPWTRKVAEIKKMRKLYFSLQEEMEEGAFLRDRKIIFRFRGNDIELCSLSDLTPGMRLQVENVLAAVTVSHVVGIDAGVISETLREFAGLEHRLEWVRTFNRIDFVNDSKGTNVGALQKSLEGFDRPIVLIAGGQDKGSDFSPLKEVIAKKVKHLVLIGEARKKLESILKPSASYEVADSMQTAVQKAFVHAAPGDVVLLSPACASFDMFRDYADRGTQFKKFVNRL